MKLMSGTEPVSVVSEKGEILRKEKINPSEHTTFIACFNIHKILVLSIYCIYVFRVTQNKHQTFR
jgi:hypothetical protein